MVASFKTPLPWTQQHGGGEEGGGPADSPATRFFYDFVLQRGSQGDLEVGEKALLVTWRKRRLEKKTLDPAFLDTPHNRAAW